jgi:8-oxo-dGTP pyrophosphatase MutT (NUDIX family)
VTAGAGEPARRPDAAALPDWLDPLLRVAETVRANDLTSILPPYDRGRAAAVLLLFWREEAGLHVLLIERSSGLRSHAGQPAFPGGAVDPEDDGPAAAALREAVEETGLDPAGVEVIAELPDLFIPHSGYIVTPVLAWWREPSPVAAVDPGEVAAVHCVPLAELVDPANRLSVRHQPTGRVMPGFKVRGMLVWGFTAGLLDRLLHLCGWEEPWRREYVEDLPDDVLALIAQAPRFKDSRLRDSDGKAVHHHDGVDPWSDDLA